MKKIDIIEQYKQVLESIGLIVEDNKVFIKDGGIEVPVTINKKHLVLPTKEWLRNPDWDNHIPFHPVCENSRRKESLVFSRLRQYIQSHIHSYLAVATVALFKLATDHDKHMDLTDEQKDVLKLLPEVDSNMTTLVNDIFLKKATIKGEHKLVHAYVARDKEYVGNKYPRLGVIDIPIMEWFNDSKEPTIFGKKIRQKDAKQLKSFFKNLFRNIDEESNTYIYGTNSPIAPNFHSLMMVYHKLATDLNRIFKPFKGSFIPKELIPNIDFLSFMESLIDYQHDIPVLLHNDGEQPEAELKAAQEKAERKIIREERRNERATVEPVVTWSKRETDRRSIEPQERRVSWGNQRDIYERDRAPVGRGVIDRDFTRSRDYGRGAISQRGRSNRFGDYVDRGYEHGYRNGRF